jgi:uncharacterized protein (TIGR02271 family)
MATTDSQELRRWIGHTAAGPDGDKIGKIADIYLDEATGQPEWLAVRTGRFGTKVSFVPLEGSALQGDELRVAFSKDQVKGAPNAEPDGALSQEEEARLYQHYGLEYSEAPSPSGLPTGDSDPGAQPTDDAMTRSEEELQVGKASRPAGRVRLRKWVETEPVSQTVPVAHEEVRVEREPVTSANLDQAMSGAEISEAEHEVTLLEEDVVAAKQAVPKERVRLEKEVVTNEERVEAELRKERIDVEGDAPA